MRNKIVVAAAVLAAAHGAPSRAADLWLAYPAGGGIEAVAVEGGRAGRPYAVARSGASDYPPGLSVSPGGMPAAAWLDADGAIRFSSFDGGGWSAPETVSPSPGAHRGIPSLALGTGGPAVAWAEAGEGGFEDILYALRTASGWTPPLRAHEPNAVPDILPSARAGADGSLGLSWRSLDGERYIGRRIGVELPEAGADSLPAGLRDALLDSGLPPETALAWNGSDGTPASATLKDLLDGEERRESAAAEEPAAPEAAAAGAIRFLAFGDSITYGRGSSTDGPATGYPAFLAGILAYNYPGQAFTMVNRGKPGETTAGGLERIDAVLAANPSHCVLLMEGTNDISNGFSFETIQENLKRMARRAAARGAIPMLATVIPTHPDARPSQYLATRAFYTGRYVQALADVYHWPYADQWNAFCSIPYWSDTIMDYGSGNHPNENGYRYVMAPRWYEAIAPHLPIPFAPTGPRIAATAVAPRVRRGGREPLSYALAPGNDVTRNEVDCYAALVNPAGKLFFFNSSMQLVSGTTPFARRVNLADVPRAGMIANLAIGPASSVGSFTFYLVTVRALRDVWDEDQRTSNLAQARFTVTP